jgi:diphthamide biosynthesis enzyme Dph1/Dph2-like protein
MKTLFIPLKLKKNLDKEKILKISKKLPKNILIMYIIQYKDYAKKVRDILKKNHKIILFSQILGCSKLSKNNKKSAILIIGDGFFHSLSFAYENNLPTYILNNNELIKISKKDIKKIQIKKKASYLNFLNSSLLGILISIKPGQEKLKKALEIKDKIKDKKLYFFISNNIDIKEFENFPQISTWINTACPRLDLESNKIINLNEIL